MWINDEKQRFGKMPRIQQQRIEAKVGWIEIPEADQEDEDE